MRKTLTVVVGTGWFVLSVCTASQATLIDRGGGLIYDTVLAITWLQDANFARSSNYSPDGRLTWNEAMTWASNLTFYDSVRSKTWDDWRLPQARPLNGSSYNYIYAFDGSSDRGYNISAPGSPFPESTASEMAYMWYNNLGNLAYFSPGSGTHPQSGHGFNETGPFLNLQNTPFYWIGTEHSLYPNQAGVFLLYEGLQGNDLKESLYFSWAVRDGDVAVPVPGTLLLFGAGIGLTGITRRRKGRGY